MEYKTNAEVDDGKTVDHVRELATIMKEMGLTTLEIDRIRIRIERMPENMVLAAAPVAATTASAPVATIPQPQASGIAVESPMVGTFYAAPGADKPPFVEVGKKVKAGDTLCIVEAMKMMNEIAAEHDGVITEVCVENKQVVEFGTVLFRIDPN